MNLYYHIILPHILELVKEIFSKKQKNPAKNIFRQDFCLKDKLNS